MKTRVHNRSALRRLAANGMVIAGLLAAGDSIEAGAPIALSKLPASVTQAADKVAPGVRWSSAYQDMDDGQVVYELEGEDAKMQDVTIDVTAAGKVLSVEMETTLAEIPTAVTTAAMSKIASFKATAAYSIRRGADLVQQEPSERAFALDGADANDREISCEITADGKIVSLEREIAVADVPQVVMKAMLGKVPQFRATSAHEIQNEGTISGYALEGTRPSAAKGKTKKAKAEAKAGEEISAFVSADGKDVEVDEG